MSITVQQMWQRFDEHAQRYYRKPSGRPTREATNVAHAFRYVVDRYGEREPESFGASQLKQCQRDMIGDDLARTTINARTNRIRRVFRWAVSEEIISSHRMAALDAVPPLKFSRTDARESSGIVAVTFDQYLPVVKHLRSPTRCILEVLWWTGMRVSEALIMRPIDLDRTNDVWLYTPREHKTEHYGTERVIALGPNAQAVIQRRIDDLGTLLFPDEQTRVFESHSGRVHTPTSLRNAVHRACDGAGVGRWTPLQLRHAAATRLRAEIGLEAARVVLGHSSATTTEIYAEIDRHKARSLMERFG